MLLIPYSSHEEKDNDVHTDYRRNRSLARWRGSALRNPHKIALVDGDTRLSYAQLFERADALAVNLRKLGLQVDDRVVVQLPNCWEFVVLTLACLRIGVIPVMALPAHRRHELEYLAEHSEAVAIIVPDVLRDFDHQELAEVIRDVVPSVKHLLILGSDVHDGNVDLGALCAEYSDDLSELDGIEISPDAIAVFLLSGGTTGLPKLIPRSHNDYLYNLKVTGAAAELDAESVYLVALPAGHNFPLACPGFLGTFLVGGSVVMLRTPEPRKAFDAIAREKVTITAAVPAVVQQWIDFETAENTGQLESLELLQVGGSRLVDELAARVTPVLGCELQQVFGMAEGLINTTLAGDPEEVVIGTQGRPVSPGDEVRVVDEDGNILPVGERGVLHTQGPYTLRGYYRADEHNKRAFSSDGWYITGDIVIIRPDGNIVVEGRDKDLINRAGEKISGEEVENLIYRHPGIEMVAAVAIPDAKLGERVCVYVTLREGVHTTLEELRELMKEANVAAYKLPEVLVVTEKMPLTKVGKIDKKALREDLARRGPIAPGSSVYPE
ncbi:MAG: 2,3-dihydroxybenzoate-AMP ligase [Actinomycetota bacterium]